MRIVLLAFLVVCSLSAQADGIEGRKVIKIGSGSLLDGYYTIGLKLCQYISQSNNGIMCDVVPTSGSLENLRLLQKGEIDFALTLSNSEIES